AHGRGDLRLGELAVVGELPAALRGVRDLPQRDGADGAIEGAEDERDGVGEVATGEVIESRDLVARDLDHLGTARERLLALDGLGRVGRHVGRVPRARAAPATAAAPATPPLAIL